MKYYLIAGEASGDLHGSNLMRGLKKADSKAQFRFFGGDFMLEQGGELVMHYKHGAFMGLWEVIKNLGTISKNMQLCKNDIQAWKPDVIILIDYPGFNLRIAEFGKKAGFPVFYYISPKVWAWKESRVKKIKQFVDRMFVIFPFEVDFYAKHNYPVYFAGNPLIDAIAEKLPYIRSEQSFKSDNALSDKPIIALLPGSRKQEIDLCLPEMLKACEKFPGYQFVIAGAPSIDKSYYSPYLENKSLNVVFGQTYDLLRNSKAAIVTSGTATLETALLGTPQVVCYKTSNITYHIGKFFVHVKFFSLVDIIMDREVVKELLQFDLAGRIASEVDLLLNNGEYRQKMLDSYEELKVKCGGTGASQRVAEKMMQELEVMIHS